MRAYEKQLADIGTASRPTLVSLWSDAYGHPPPKGMSRRILEYSAAYHLQAKALGGLPRNLKRKLAKCNIGGGGPDSHSAVVRTAKAPPPGSRLVREWHGVSHTVDVTDRGFIHDGRQYGSLSEVARAITGARWSGPRFFGL